MSDFVKILGATRESHDTMTFEFRWDEKASPGQFVMVWVPGMEEVPMSLSRTNRIKSITVKAIGDDTRRLHELRLGDSLRVRGPYGRGFSLKKGVETLAIGGGAGTAAIMPAVKEIGADVIIGARTEADVIMDDLASKYSKNVWISTDDGSRGFRGNAVQLMREKAAEKSYGMVLACGPEVMLRGVLGACSELGLDCQLSMERHMKCGAGLCGCCVIDGQRVCKDGPVFTGEQAARMPEFGSKRRDEAGRLVGAR
ncbi:MAG: dihydroorotate dehydrogenase electron transfer subunit [Candidatus Methanoplasma sp.]|jgi:dihydroorotate dehydrogenase electron transfer subunit|nr:dihydroorotate dehydrogenase electron transfer subunit [Candidatus Methanoplasma sp.]